MKNDNNTHNNKIITKTFVALYSMYEARLRPQVRTGMIQSMSLFETRMLFSHAMSAARSSTELKSSRNALPLN